MGDEHGFGFWRESLLYFVGANVIRLGVAVDEHGHERILEYRVYRRRKARGDRDDLIARFQGALPEFGGGQGGERD